MSARDLAAFVADLRDYNSGVMRARYAYYDRDLIRLCACGNELGYHRQKCDECRDLGRRNHGANSARRKDRP